MSADILRFTQIKTVQMQVDGYRVIMQETPQYKSVIDCGSQLFAKHSFLGMWRGCIPNVQRGAIIQIGDLFVYDRVKRNLLQLPYFNDNIWAHGASSIVSGFLFLFFFCFWVCVCVCVCVLSLPKQKKINENRISKHNIVYTVWRCQNTNDEWHYGKLSINDSLLATYNSRNRHIWHISWLFCNLGTVRAMAYHFLHNVWKTKTNHRTIVLLRKQK